MLSKITRHLMTLMTGASGVANGAAGAVPAPSAGDGDKYLAGDATWKAIPELPPGMIVDFAGAAAPAGWLLCYGQAVSRTTYAALFAAIGTTYGAGNGSTTFNLPDLRGRVTAGLDNMGGVAANRLTVTTMTPNGNTRGATGGSQTHTLTVAQIPPHDHDYTHVGAGTQNWGIAGGLKHNVAAKTGQTGSGSAHPNVQPTMTLNKIIKT